MASEILRGLYLGNTKDAQSMTGVDMVLNCTHDVPFFADESCVKIRIQCKDNGDPREAKILFDALEDLEMFQQIDKVLRNNGKVLVHCAMGVQRSAAVVACFVVWKYNMDPFDAIAFVKSRRPIAFFGSVNFMDTITHFYKSVC